MLQQLAALRPLGDCQEDVSRPLWTILQSHSELTANDMLSSPTIALL